MSSFNISEYAEESLGKSLVDTMSFEQRLEGMKKNIEKVVAVMPSIREAFNTMLQQLGVEKADDGQAPVSFIQQLSDIQTQSLCHLLLKKIIELTLK